MSESPAVEADLRRAFTAYRLGDIAGAGDACFQVLRQQPDNFFALHLLGVLALQSGRTRDGVEILTRAVALNPAYALAHGNLGNGLRDLKRPEEALASYDRAIALDPGFAEAHGNRGNALAELRRPLEALASFDRAIALKPDFAEAHNNRGGVLIELKRYEEALASCNSAIALRPGMAKAWGSRAMALNKLKNCGEAARSYAKLLEIDPQHPFMKGLYLYQKMQSCDWNDFNRLVDEIENDIACGRLSADPFGWQGVARSPRSLQLCARQFSEKRFPANIKPYSRPQWTHQRKIRIGYVSGEFREHATSLLLVGMLEQHDRSRFEIFAFDNGWNDQSETRGRIDSAAHQVISIRDLSDSQAAAVIAEHGIDILVNLNGYFGGDRTLVFAQRPAPIQVSFLGFPGTLGASYIDYIIADRHVIPPGDEVFYSEKIACLPNSYQPNDRNKLIAERRFSRAECGLPEKGFVFCCFNNNYKILPAMFDVWMRILDQAPGSVLWLLEDNELASANLRKEALARGVDPARLLFAQRMKLSDHLARHACADLFLDTLPYNAHTTGSDALWAGLPVLTCRGETFPGRVGASLLQAVGLPELIAADLKAYEQLAVDLAAHPARLARLKQKLADNRLTTPLFDTRLFTRHIETAYTAMCARLRAQLEPDHITIPNA